MGKLVETVNSLAASEFFEQYASRDILGTVSAVDLGIALSANDAATISKDTLESCLALIEETSAHDYQHSEMKWSTTKKRKEMKLPDMKYITLIEEQSGNLIGFISFMVTYEDGYEVLYIYEIHFIPQWQGKGIGKKLVHVIEQIGNNVGLEKVMLTVFRTNTRAVNWYQNLGYVEDEFSPGPRKLRNGTIKEPTYIIMSKVLRS